MSNWSIHLRYSLSRPYNNSSNKRTMRKVDCESNNWLAEALVVLSSVTNVFSATADCNENYNVDDLWISAYTTSGNWVALPLENKTIKGGFQLKYDGQWNDYFSVENPNGIMKKLSGDTIPQQGHIYFINSSKYNKLVANNCCLAYLAPDGFILFSPKSLRKAFLGMAWYKNKSHTEEFGEWYNPHWEEKAIINLEAGTYYHIQGPKEIFNKR